MKILSILDHNPYASSSATANRFISLAEGLQVCGNQIDLLLMNGYLDRQEYETFGHKGTHNSINYKYINPVLFKNKYIRKPLKVIFFKALITKKLTKIILESNYDYVWIGYSSIALKVGLSLVKENLPVKFFHERSEFSWIGIKNKHLHRNYVKNFLSRIDVMSIMTQKLISYYHPFLGEHTQIIHLPMTVDLERFEIDKSETDLKQPYIAYCGSMNNEKDGVDILIKSFINIMQDFPEYHLYLAGPLKPVRDYKHLQNIIITNKAAERIHFLGSTHRDDIPQFLKNAEILAMARPNSKQAEGGFPTKLGEYLATGNPVCLTNVGEISEYLKNGESAYIAKPDDIESFKSVLQLAIRSQNASYVGLNGKRIASKHFDKMKQAQLLSEILDKQLC